MAIDTVKINGKDYPLTFGLEFIRYLDENVGVQAEGVRLGMGLQMAVAKLHMPGSVVVFFDLIKAATATLAQKPNNKGIEDWVFDNTETDEAEEQLRDDFLEALEQSRWTKRTMIKLQEATKEEEIKEKNKKKS